MSVNLKKTKRNLAIVFTTMVFFLILLFWTFSFLTKYLKGYSFEKNQFANFFDVLQKNEVNLNEFKNWINNTRKQKFIKWQRIWWNLTQIQEINIEKEFKPWEFINFILLNEKNEIISIDIIDNISDLLLNNIIKSDDYYKITKKLNFLIKKIHLKNTGNTIIFFKKLSYSLNNLFEDILSFTIILFVFSVLLYYIWYKFVDETLKPVEENIKDMNDFIHNVGHELKTPLSVIDSDIQMIKDTKKYDKEMIQEIKNEIIKLNSLIDSLVKLSDINSFKNVSEINLSEIIKEILNDFSLKINEKNIIINCEIQEKVEVKANRDYFYMFLSNLIWNAIKYNKKDGKIDISCKSSTLIIKDTWVWVDKKDINKVFDRFYKADKSRNTEWFWIWLSLVKKIADIYKWKININSEKWKWTEIIIKF